MIREAGLPDAQRLSALLAFNLGVEIGQIAVVLAAGKGSTVVVETEGEQADAALAALLQFLFSFTLALLAFWVLEVATFIFIAFAFEYVAGGHLFPLDILPPAVAAVVTMGMFCRSRGLLRLSSGNCT